VPPRDLECTPCRHPCRAQDSQLEPRFTWRKPKSSFEPRFRIYFGGNRRSDDCDTARSQIARRNGPHACCAGETATRLQGRSDTWERSGGSLISAKRQIRGVGGRGGLGSPANGLSTGIFTILRNGPDRAPAFVLSGPSRRFCWLSGLSVAAETSIWPLGRPLQG
jgi:hypothetical protein